MPDAVIDLGERAAAPVAQPGPRLPWRRVLRLAALALSVASVDDPADPRGVAPPGYAECSLVTAYVACRSQGSDGGARVWRLPGWAY
ncbi:hypothetical protein [Luedemannella helvata]|uniref:Uncharacterized protein n=1 Tax=Luedemannella helvata TaxID=349315 RepID=A0ABP4XB92_9ACTN